MVIEYKSYYQKWYSSVVEHWAADWEVAGSNTVGAFNFFYLFIPIYLIWYMLSNNNALLNVGPISEVI